MALFTVEKKRKFTYVVIAMVFLFGGIEYAVILPTMWLYIQHRFNAEEYFLGLMLSAFCFSGLFSGPVMGRWSDVTRKTKVILLFANCWEIAGNIMYFIGLSKWFLFASRLVSGVGTGAEATLIAELVRNTPAEKRTGILSIFIAIRQFGLLIGPGFNLFLRELNFHIGPFLVDKYSAPGAFMAILWCFLQLVILCFYFELSSIFEQKDNNDETVISQHSCLPTNQMPVQGSVTVTDCPEGANHVSASVNSLPYTHGVYGSPSSQSISYDEEFTENTGTKVTTLSPHIAIIQALNNTEHETWQNSSDLIESAERFMTSSKKFECSAGFEHIHHSDVETSPHSVNDYGSIARNTNTGPRLINNIPPLAANGAEPEIRSVGTKSYPWSYYYNEYMREGVVVLLAIQFISFFNQVSLETMVTPLTQQLLNWGELENSLMYCAAGAEIIVVFILVRWLSRRLLDRTMLLIGVVVLTLANAWLIWVVPRATPGAVGQNLPKFIVGLILDMFALPFLIVCSVSLYSKITHKETQGFSQGLRRSVSGIATIMGPLWAGAALPWPYIMFGVMLGLIVLGLVLLLLSFSKLNVVEDVEKRETPSDGFVNERKPLLS